MAAATDSGGETGYESNDSSSTMNAESPHSGIEYSSEQRVPSPLPCFNFSSLSQDVLEPPAGLSFVSVLPLDDAGYTIFPRDEFRCKMRSNIMRMRQNMRWKYVHRFLPKIKDILAERKLRIAASLNNVDAVRNLLDSGVDPKSADKRKRTALHLSACKGYTDIVQILLERGADPNQKDVVGNTPLHLAACTNHINVITVLLRHGADPKSLDNSGRSPLQLAQSKLKHFHNSCSCSSVAVRNEIPQIIQMLHTYLQKSGLEAEAELLSAFQTRLTLSKSEEEADDSVRDLLFKLSDLSLRKA